MEYNVVNALLVPVVRMATKTEEGQGHAQLVRLGPMLVRVAIIAYHVLFILILMVKQLSQQAIANVYRGTTLMILL
jgi:hypothetical protein